MPIWLVTGGTGFLGGHLLDLLEKQRPAGIDLALLGRRPPRRGSAGAFFEADLADAQALGRSLAAIAPEVVFHLAGQTPPAEPDRFYRGNTLATIHLLEALRACRKQPTRVVLAGSAAELGPTPAGDLPVAEDYHCRPDGSYGLSKLLATTAGLAARPPLEVISARIFNPIGPGLPRSQAFGRFAALLAQPQPDPLCFAVGNLEARRDFIDVRDVAAALLALAQRGEAGTVYHVGTGQSQRVGDGLDYLVRLSGREVTVEVEVRPRHTPSASSPGPGASDSRADIRRIITATGWRPQVAWHRSLEDLWNAARTARDREY